MFPLIVYNVFLGICCGYALARGGTPERIAALIMGVGSVITIAIPAATAYQSNAVIGGVLVIDMVCFAGSIPLALRSNRLWPIWVSALLGLGVLGHLARWYGGSFVSARAYVLSIVIWSYPILTLIVIGTLNHQRRLARDGADLSWIDWRSTPPKETN